MNPILLWEIIVNFKNSYAWIHKPSWLQYFKHCIERYIFILVVASGKESDYQWRRCTFDPWLGRSSGGGNGNLPQYSCLGNPMDRRACQTTSHGVAYTHAYVYISIQFSSVAQSCLTLCDPMDCNMPDLPVYHQIPEFTQTHVHWVGDATQPSHPLSNPSPPTFNLFQHQALFKWVSSSHQVTKVLEFQLQHQSFHEYSGLISFRMDWLDLLAVQGTLKSLLQNYSSKASILQRSAFFIRQLSHRCTTTGKTRTLTRWTFVGKVMSLLFKMLSRLVITYLPRSTRLLISWLQSPSAVILKSKKFKSALFPHAM